MTNFPAFLLDIAISLVCVSLGSKRELPAVQVPFKCYYFYFHSIHGSRVRLVTLIKEMSSTKKLKNQSFTNNSAFIKDDEKKRQNIIES